MKLLARISIFLISAMVMSLPLLAQVDSVGADLMELSLEQLHNIKIVTASKNKIAAGQAPASVIVITEEQIRLRGYRSLLDVLVDLPDFKVDDNAYSTNRNFFTIRGIEGQQNFIIMLNGVRISPPANESIPIMENYPVNLAKQIEIIYGPASALYGADALSGIINIITEKAEFAASKSTVSYGMGDHGLYNGSAYTSNRVFKDALLTVSGQFFYDGGVDLSRYFKNDSLWDMTSHQTGVFNTRYGPMTPAEPVASQYAAPLKAYNFYTGFSVGAFEFSFFKNYAENSTAIENNPDNAVYNKDVFYGRGLSVFNSRYEKSLDNISLVTTFTASQYKVNPKSNYRNLYTQMERAYKYGYSSMIRVEQQVEWKLMAKSTLVGGAVAESFYAIPESPDLQSPVEESRSIEGVFLKSPSYYRPEGIEAKLYTVKYYNAGGYVQLQQKAGQKMDLTIGARFDYNSRFGSTFNPRVGMVWSPGNDFTVKALAATAYQAPTPGLTYSYYGTFQTLDSGKTYYANFFHLPNPKLKPIISRNLEMSARKYFGNNFSTTLTGYYTHVNNLIGYAADEESTNLYNGKFLGWDVDYIEVFVNHGQQQIYGGSVQLDYNYNVDRVRLNAYAALSYVNGNEEFHRTGEDGTAYHFDVELKRIAHWILKSGVDFRYRGWSVAPRLSWLSRQHVSGFVNEETPDKRQTIDGYALLRIALGYTKNKVELFCNVSNALNQKILSVGANVDMRDRNTEFFYGNYQNPIRFNGGVNIRF